MLSPAPAQTPVTAPISLLRLIAENPEFRAKVESDPVAAFAEHGISLDPSTRCSNLPANGFLSGLAEDDSRELEGNNRWLGLL